MTTTTPVAESTFVELEARPDAASEGNPDAAHGDSAADNSPKETPESEGSPADSSATEGSVTEGESAAEGAPQSEGDPKDPQSGDAQSEGDPAPKRKRPKRRRRNRDAKELVEYKRVVEGLLFSSKEPVGINRLGTVIGDLTAQEVKTVVEAISKDLRRQKRGVMIEEVAGGYRIVTVPELSEAVKKLHRIRTEDRLSPAALETLAIVAYRQPVMRADIEVIRGVACGGTLKWLMEKGLVKILGRADVLGRPLLYGTTRQFLEQFGIHTIKDLPRVDEFRAKS